MVTRPVKGGVYTVIADGDESWVTGVESSPHGAGRPRLPRWVLYALVAGGVTLVVGLGATLWVWTRFGTAGLQQAGAGGRHGHHPGTASLVLGPLVALAGVGAMIGACAVHEARQRREARLARTRQEFFDPLATPQHV